MKKSVKRIALALSICLVAALFTGCFSSFDAAKFVKGNIDSIYLGTWDSDYLDMVVNTEAELKSDYEDGLKAEADYFIYYFSIVDEYLTDDMYNEIVDMYREIYSHSKYEVGEATKSGDNYLVSVTIYPIDIFDTVMNEDADAFMADYEERYAAGEFDAMDDEEFEQTWARMVIDMVKARMGNIGNLAAETVSVQIVLEGSGSNEYYTISENDFERIDALMIQY